MSIATNNKCADCGKELQAHEIPDHYKTCPKRQKRMGRPRTVLEQFAVTSANPPKPKEEEDFKPPETISLEMIQKIASGDFKPEVKIVEKEVIKEVPAQLGFTCIICGDTQIINHLQEYNKGIPGVCDNCISDLKEIILLKRKKNEKTSQTR